MFRVLLFLVAFANAVLATAMLYVRGRPLFAALFEPPSPDIVEAGPVADLTFRVGSVLMFPIEAAILLVVSVWAMAWVYEGFRRSDHEERLEDLLKPKPSSGF